MSQTRSTSITGADGIRAVACLWVFVSHISNSFALREPEGFHLLRVVHHGDMGVSMFFVLSGFLLSLPFWTAHQQAHPFPSLSAYAALRLGRIAPGLYLCVGVLYFVHRFYTNKWETFVAATSLTFTSSLLPGTYQPSWDPPLWSISIEMIFYLLLPLFMWVAFRRRTVAFARAWCVVAMAGIALGHWAFLRSSGAIERLVGNPDLFLASNASTTKNAVGMFAHFLIGSLAALEYVRLRRARQAAAPAHGGRTGLWDTVAALAMLAMILDFAQSFDVLPGFAHMQYHWPTFGLLVGLLLCVLPFTSHVGPLLDHRFFRVTADLSYGIYIWHAPLIYGLEAIWPWPWQATLVNMLAFGSTALAASYAVAFVSFRLVERPVLVRVKSWTQSRRINRLGAGR